MVKPGDIIGDKRVAWQKDDGDDPRDIYCTTYQMRNFYELFGDGLFKSYDFMNYVQHYKVAEMLRPGQHVLDVCCGRSLLMNLIQWQVPDLGLYVGVDICEANLQEATKPYSAHHRRRFGHKEFFKFPHAWILSDVAEMSKNMDAAHVFASSSDKAVERLRDKFDFVVYTSSIEHMHKEVGEQSLRECYSLMRDNALMFISCPRTEGGGFETQYRAHVYEWGLEELRTQLTATGFEVLAEIGLIASPTEIKNFYKELPEAYLEVYEAMCAYLPAIFARCVFAIPFPEIAKEVLFIVQKGA